jgi:hypothetical protein
VVAQRLKRRSSVELKLRRNPDMALSRMQDIGGCRAVLRTVDRVDRLLAFYDEPRSRQRNIGGEFVAKRDYISAPKADGYRSVHLIYKYRSSARPQWDGLRIEIQVRSRFQHAWATALETVDTFTSQSLKAGAGILRWRRFFVLMSTAIARLEKRPDCPDCPESPELLKGEVRELATELRVEALLNGWSEALRYLPIQPRARAGVHLLYLDSGRDELTATSFSDADQARASEAYMRAESEAQRQPAAQAVLVSVEAVQALRIAFPNYFADTTLFVGLLRTTLEVAKP